MVCFEISNNDDGIKLMINDFKDKNLCFANTNISNILIIYIYNYKFSFSQIFYVSLIKLYV